MSAPAPDLRAQFLDAMSRAANMVTIVATDGGAGRAGVTVSAMASVSADTDQPTLAVCVNANGASAAAILANGVFSVNFLRDDQSFVSDVFAGRFADRFSDKFDCGTWEAGATGAPLLRDALASFDCRIVAVHRVGLHYLVLGEVHAVLAGTSGMALVYARRSYSSPQPIDIAHAGAPGEGDRLSLGCFHTFAPMLVPRLIRQLSDIGSVVGVDLVEGDNRRLRESLASGEVELALLHDFAAPPDMERTVVHTLKAQVLLPADHPLTARSTITPGDLVGIPMISVAEESSRAYLEGLLNEAGVQPQILFRSSSLEMTRGLVGQGLGFAITLTPLSTDQTHDGNRVIARPLLVAGKPPAIVAVTRANQKLSPAASLALAELMAMDRDPALPELA